MSVADAASLRTVAVQLRALSADEENQPIIAREDGCLRALVSFVAGADADVAAIAVAAVRNLAAHPDNFDLLRAEDGLLRALRALLVADRADAALRRAAFGALEDLTDEEDDAEMDELDELERAAGLRTPDASGGAPPDDPALLADPATARLHVPGLSDDLLCVRVEQLLIRRPGVISVVFELGAEDAIVYGRVPPPDLAAYVATMTGADVCVVAAVEESEDDGDDGEAAAAAAAAERAGGAAVEDKENGAPGYLDQTGERFRDVARKNAKKKNTVSQGATSLAARLEAQRQEESRKRARSSRLMHSIGQGFNKGWGFGW